jgi:hypothetical protein
LVLKVPTWQPECRHDSRGECDEDITRQLQVTLFPPMCLLFHNLLYLTDKSTYPFDFGDIYGTPLHLTSILRNYYDLLTESCDSRGTCHQLLFSPSPFSP